ncbi:hypothetical protein ACFXC2_07035, partial [Streptomyces lavendulae]
TRSNPANTTFWLRPGKHRLGSFEIDDRATVKAVLATLLETLAEEAEERLMIGGTANLTRFGHDFPLTIRPVLESLCVEREVQPKRGEGWG